MSLGSTQPLTEMNTRSISWGKGGRCIRMTTYHNPVPLSRNLGTLTSWNPLGHSRTLTGLLYLCFYILHLTNFSPYVHSQQNIHINTYVPRIYRCSYPGILVFMATKFCSVASNILDLQPIHVTLLVPRILMSVLDSSGKVFQPSVYIYNQLMMSFLVQSLCTCNIYIIIISNLSNDRSKASSKTIPPLSAI